MDIVSGLIKYSGSLIVMYIWSLICHDVGISVN